MRISIQDGLKGIKRSRAGAGHGSTPLLARFLLVIFLFTLASNISFAAVSSPQITPADVLFAEAHNLPSPITQPEAYKSEVTSSFFIDSPHVFIINNVAFMFTDTYPWNAPDASGWTIPDTYPPIIYMSRERVRITEAYTLCLHEWSHVLFPNASEEDTVKTARIADYAICHELNDALIDWSMKY